MGSKNRVYFKHEYHEWGSSLADWIPTSGGLLPSYAEVKTTEAPVAEAVTEDVQPRARMRNLQSELEMALADWRALFGRDP